MNIPSINDQILKERYSSRNNTANSVGSSIILSDRSTSKRSMTAGGKSFRKVKIESFR